MFGRTIEFLKRVYKEKYKEIVGDHIITVQIRIPKSLYTKIEDGIKNKNEFNATSRQKYIKKIIDNIINDMNDYENIFNQMDDIYKDDKIRTSVGLSLSSVEKANEILKDNKRKDNKFLVACLYKYFKNLDSK